MKVLKIILLLITIFLLFLFTIDNDLKIKRYIYNNYIYSKYTLFDIWYFFKTDMLVNKKQFVKPKEDDSDRFIAHSGGQIDNYAYTDTLEALNENYKKGFRLFELDIIKTKDNFFVASHDWDTWKKQTKYKKNIPPTLNEFKKYKIYNKYTPIDINDINQWFKNHKNSVLVTDKINNPKEFSKIFINKKQLIMELFDWYAVKEAQRVNITAMPTGNIVKKLKRNILYKLNDLKISHIAVSRRFRNKILLKNLINNNIKIYAFHVNFDKGKDEKYVFCNEFEYFYGLYADKWDFQKIDCNNYR